MAKMKDGDWFCGENGGVFWDLNLTWYGSRPDFTPCFKDTVLLWIPTVMFWLLVPFDLIQLYRNRGYPSKSTIARVQLLSLFFTGIIFVASIVARTILWQLGKIDWFWIGFASYVIYAFTMLAIAELCWKQMRAGFTGSGAIWLFLMTSVVCASIQFASMLEEDAFDEQTQNQIHKGLFVAYYVLIVITLVVFSFSSVPVPSLIDDNEQEPFPEDFCSFPNNFTFAWVVPTLWKGYKRDLEIKDLWAMHPTEKSSALTEQFEKIFRREFATVVESKRFSGIKTIEIDESIPDVEIRRPIKPPSMLKIFAKEFGGSALIAGFLELINVVLVFVEPIVIGLLTSFATNLGSEPTWHGYFYAGVMACSLFVRSFLEQVAWFRMVRLGRNVNSVLIGSIYRKALRITSEARKSSTLGEIVNLMSVDAGRFFDFAIDMHTIWSCPLQFILGFYIAYSQVGLAVFSGIGYIVILSLVNGVATRFYEKLQEQQMELKDDRIKLLTEVLNGMKVVKLYGWEPAFQRRMQEIRDRELKCMRHSSYIGAFFEFSWHSTVLVASFAVLATFVATTPDHTLNAQSVFVIISIFRILTFPLSVLPAVLAHFVMIRVSLKRVLEFFSGQELEEDLVHKDGLPSEIALRLENATLAWDATRPILHGITLDVPRGKLVAVVGKVGVGKSSLLSALCGEMHKVSGVINIQGSVAYVPQQAWIQNMTIKDNVLFGKALNERNYNRVIEASCLKPDLDALPAGDLTEIGERGINLSGGQKQRVSLARAVYQNRDLYLLDDPLSAVDVHVGKHIFQHVIGAEGVLKDKTRILVTHALTYLPECDLVVVIADGRIDEVGTFRELVAKKGAFAEFAQQYIVQASEEEIEELLVKAPEFEELTRMDSVVNNTLEQRISITRQRTQDSGGPKSPIMDMVLNRLTSISSEYSDKSEFSDTAADCGDHGKLIDEELMNVGEVTWTVYFTYCKAAGYGLFLYALFVLLSLVFEMLGNIWLQKWSDNAQQVRQNVTAEVITTSRGLLYLGLCGIGQTSFTLMLGVAFAIFQVKAARLIHDRLISSILKASMGFFDTTPTGRVINRCGRDVNEIDNEVPGSLDQYSHFFFSLIYSIVGLFIYVPIFGAFLLPAAIVYVLIQKTYIRAARRVRRLEAVTSSPIYSHFQETLQGISSIRAFSEEERFCEISDKLVDVKFSAQLARTLFNRWVSVAMDGIANAIVAAITFAVVHMVINGQMTAGVAGLSLSSFALNLPGLLAWGVHVASMLEMEMVSLERIMEYSNVKSEAPWTSPTTSVSPSWPSQGRVLFNQYGTRYRDGLPLVLHDFSADVRPMEKIGVVGRTGAGKSSLTLALFRILEAAEGQILIDDMDISRLGLHELRWKLSIIPQDPVLFSGPLRMNLDPFDQHTDDELWLALERSKLKEFVSALPDSFGHQVDEGGSNLSVGQRQLICLARALLRKSKILILDEATAAIDVETDAWIQATIREQFKDCTIITIAHRLNTIMDSDRIMVLDNGRLVECDTPAVLTAREDSIFGNMVKEANRGSKS